MSGTFITIEGIEGAGKSTVAHHLHGWLKARSHTCLCTREPGGTSLGEQLRSMVLHSREPLAPMTELLLFQTARAQLMNEVILPALERGETVLLDRHTDSTMAYQGYGRGIDRHEIATLNRIATSGRSPDITILLDLDAHTGLQRARSTPGKPAEPDRFESETLDFMQKVRNGFLAIAEAEPDRCMVINAEQSEDLVWSELRQRLETNPQMLPG